MDLRITVDRVGGSPVVALEGAADLAGIPALRRELRRAVAAARGEQVLVDLDGVSVLDDAALGLLLGASAAAREAGGDVVLVCSAERIARRLTETRLDQVMTVRPTIV